MPVELENSSPVTVSTASGEASVTSSGNQTAIQAATQKKKRNLPGMPDPDAEVIALSPKTLMTTNRFVCEICKKGFQRDQNLQLHRRGHNLPWKLRQRSSKEVRKRVYVCPEASCVHHHPSRALGDLTGIKKHFSRKHGEKKWKCDKCSKKYAVQSDWKAHSKTCGTREYRCDCGTLFSRRDSFITHRAFCDALAEESARAQTVPNSNSEEDPKLQIVATSSPPPPASSSTIISAVLPIQTPELPENPTGFRSGVNGNSSNSVFASLFASATAAGNLQPQSAAFSDLICAMACSERQTHIAPEPTSLCLSSTNGSSLFAAAQDRRQYASASQPGMSATALLQKAAQMGATATNASLLRGLGIALSGGSSGQDESLQWNHHVEVEGGSGPGLRELMMGSSSLFGPKPTTLDFLGLGMNGGGAPVGGFSALIKSMGGGLDGGPEIKPNSSLL
ncbi:hypothetical protein HHK36_008489 [Tetracentron sinense]|uniref:C2H2-type domain-containing protein n=1 Tax=Tetracentron sinense TaxID=13715 RepID=A0A834ZQ95_TETSI|nr:hypothetical protein HHK36_008489 [Tetracentron sinense]